MASLLDLPLDIHILIARFLPLREQLIFASFSDQMYYAVHYVFAHAETLDFTSLLGPPLIYQNMYHKRIIIRLAPPRNN